MGFDSFITLGRSGLRVSEFGLGSAAFGEEIGYGVNAETSHRIIDRYIERGGNFIDTANLYSCGHSEAIIGDYFVGKPALRDRTVLSTKFFGNLFPGDPNGGGASRRTIIAQCEESLRRMKTDYIDLYWMHCWDPFTPIDETMRALDDLVTQGKIRYIGFSDGPAWKTAQAQMIAQLRGMTQFIALELEYSLMERTIEGEHVPMALEMGMGILPWGALRSGVLTGAFGMTRTSETVSKRQSVNSTMNNLSPKNEAILAEVKRIADELGASMAAVALAWVKARPGISVTLLGADDPDQIDANAAATQLKLDATHMEALNEVSKPALNFPHDFHTFLANSLAHAGATVNGVPSSITPLQPKTDAERF
ncbi:aldo/keto reductase [Sphingobium sp.]|uniref:aldo/keto reductase n=1 Tax=Sphingobium sp. TaxID=1912891 RepID=UPI00261EB101|nr:aldo/keto reductase [Sphingobium sp.]